MIKTEQTVGPITNSHKHKKPFVSFLDTAKIFEANITVSTYGPSSWNESPPQETLNGFTERGEGEGGTEGKGCRHVIYQSSLNFVPIIPKTESGGKAKITAFELKKKQSGETEGQMLKARR